jgi:hypothetical protein
MSQQAPRADLAAKTVLYTMTGVDDVIVRRDQPYKTTEDGALTMDVYYPPESASATRLPAVIFGYGYSDVGYPNMLGCTFKEMGMNVSWARLFAAAGLVAIVYGNRQPVEDVTDVLRSIQDNAESLRIDRHRIGLWAESGNVPLALSLLMPPGHGYLRCAAFSNGFMLDLDGKTGVAEMQRTYHFANPCEGKSVDDVRSDVPMLLVRSGQDQFPGINESLDNFLIHALRRDLPVTLVNHQGAPHGFELYLDDARTYEIVRQILGFMRFHLSTE